MRTNPGAPVPAGQVIGRDGLVAEIWRVLSRQSVILSAERRMGKTSVLNKMEAEAPPGMLVFRLDVEDLSSPLAFVEEVYRRAAPSLGAAQRMAGRFHSVFQKLAGVEIAGVLSFPAALDRQWKLLLEALMRDLADEPGRRVVFLWDEIPLFLLKVKKREGVTVAADVLDSLRAIRQEHPSIRMVFSGSVGLHMVLGDLYAAGEVNAPVNDMKVVEVPPLAPGDGALLARLLIEGEGIRVTDPDAAARAVSAAVDHIPFYIHHVVDAMRREPRLYAPGDARAIVSRNLRDSIDPWHMAHYRNRLFPYYLPETHGFALALLDILAAADRGLRFSELFNLLKSRIATENAELVRAVVALLRRDFYLVQRDDGALAFRTRLIREWWRWDRGIA